MEIVKIIFTKKSIHSIKFKNTFFHKCILSNKLNLYFTIIIYNYENMYSGSKFVCWNIKNA